MSGRPEERAAERGGGFTFAPALQLMAGRLVGFAATFFVPVVLARVFEPAQFGTYKQLFLIYTTLFSLGQMGMAESLFYFLPLEPEKSGRFQTNALFGLVLSGLAALAGLWFGRHAIAAWLNNPELAGLLPLLGAYLLFMLAAAGLEIGLMCRQRYLAATTSYALSDVLRAAAMLAPAVVVGGVRWLLLGALAFAMIRLLAHLALLVRQSGGGADEGGGLRPDRGLARRQLGYSLPFQLAVMVEVAQANLHQFAVSTWFDAATFAVYAVGCLQIPLVDFAASSAGNVLMVGMGRALKEGDREAAREIWTGTTRKLALILVPLVALLLVAADDLIPFLYTERYRASVPIFMVWTTIVLLSVFQTDAVLRVYAEVRFILYMNLARLGVIVASIAGLVALFGLVGAVAATVLGTLVAKGLALARIRRRLGTAWAGVLPWRDLGAVAAASAAAAVPAVWLRPELAHGTFATLAILGTTYAVALLVVMLAFGVLRDEEIEAVTGAVKRLLARGARGEPSADEVGTR